MERGSFFLIFLGIIKYGPLLYNLILLFEFNIFASSQRSVQTDQSMKDKFDSDPVFFTRTRGLFRVCFPHERPDQDKGEFIVSYFFAAAKLRRDSSYYVLFHSANIRNFFYSRPSFVQR
jgi:hypothetical protein